MAPGTPSPLKAASLVSVQEESPGRWLGAQSSSHPWFTRQMDDPGFLGRTGTEGEPQTATLWKCWEQQGPPASNWGALPGTIGQAGEEGECGRGNHRRKRKQQSWLRERQTRWAHTLKTGRRTSPGLRWAHSRPNRTYDGEWSRSSDAVLRGAAFLEGSLEVNIKFFRSLTI